MTVIKDFLNLNQNTLHPTDKNAYPNLLIRLGELNSLKIFTTLYWEII